MVNHIKNTLHLTKGRIYGENGAAQLLEINPNTLRSRMRKLKIPFGTKE
jgi:transcriptional regulator with GAF, ATPase, and Fis domain